MRTKCDVIIVEDITHSLYERVFTKETDLPLLHLKKKKNMEFVDYTVSIG